MLSTKSSDLHHKTLLIKQDDKFFTRLLSRELSMTRTNTKLSSFRGLPSSVPFVWESHPGTPKHHFHIYNHEAEPIPPLTPPPSFYSTTLGSSKSNIVKRQSSSLHALFRKLSIIVKKVSLSSTKQETSSLTISSYAISSSSTWSSSSRTRRSWGGSSSSSPSKVDEEDCNFTVGSPTSTLCFMVKRKQSIDLQKKDLIHVREIMF